jgi:leucyl-tRNA synthetase
VSDRAQFENARINRKGSTEAEEALWQQLRNNKVGYKFRRQHPVDGFIADFACLQKGLIIEVDGGYHNNPEQQAYDAYRTKELEELGFIILRFSNDEVLKNVYAVRDQIKIALVPLKKDSPELKLSSPLSNSVGEVLGVRVYTTRPDTIFGVDFMVIAPEHELVSTITTTSQKSEIDSYLTYVKSRSERERLAEVTSILLIVVKSLSGSVNMFWLVTEPGQLWRFRVAISAILLLQNISIFR